MLISLLCLLLCLFLRFTEVLFFLLIFEIGVQIISHMFLFTHFVFYVDVNSFHVLGVFRAFLNLLGLLFLCRMGSENVSFYFLFMGFVFHVNVFFRIFVFILEGSGTRPCISWFHASIQSIILIPIVLAMVALVRTLLWNHFNSNRIVAFITLIYLTKAWAVFQLRFGLQLWFRLLRTCFIPVWQSILVATT